MKRNTLVAAGLALTVAAGAVTALLVSGSASAQSKTAFRPAPAVTGSAAKSSGGIPNLKSPSGLSTYGAKDRVLHKPGQTGTAQRGTGHWKSWDDFLGFVITDVDAYWERVFRADGLALPTVKYVFPGPGGYASACTNDGDTSAYYCGADDTIVFSKVMAEQMWTGKFTTKMGRGPGGDIAPAFVVAHEYAHNVENELGVFGGGYSDAQTENLADCWAGVWLNSAYHRGLLDPGDVNEALWAAFIVGDSTGTHHGTSQQRMDAVKIGYNSGNPMSCVNAIL